MLLFVIEDGAVYLAENGDLAALLFRLAFVLLHNSFYIFYQRTLLLRGSYKFSMFPMGSSHNQVYFLYRIKSDVIQRVCLS